MRLYLCFHFPSEWLWDFGALHRKLQFGQAPLPAARDDKFTAPGGNQFSAAFSM
jgi:hypothetical protein